LPTRSRWEEGAEVSVGVVGGEVFVPKPRALRRAARPGEGLRGWRTGVFAFAFAFAGVDERLFTIAVFVFEAGVEREDDDGIDETDRVEFSLTSFG